MSYRDDVDSLYSRALILQKELDAARDELAQLKGRRADTSPGIREIQRMPDPFEAHERLVDTSSSEDLSPIPMPNWDHIVTAKLTPASMPPIPMPTTRSLVERLRMNASRLREEDLVMIAKIVEELTDGNGNDELLRNRLRWLASELAAGIR